MAALHPAVGAFCAHQVFELAQEKGVRDLEVSFAAIEVGRHRCALSMQHVARCKGAPMHCSGM